MEQNFDYGGASESWWNYNQCTNSRSGSGTYLGNSHAYLYKTDTQKRPRPSDLFGSWTARATRVRFTTYGTDLYIGQRTCDYYQKYILSYEHGRFVFGGNESHYYDVALPSVPNVGDVDDQVRGNIKRMRNDVGIGQNVAEARQTAGMAKDVYQRSKATEDYLRWRWNNHAEATSRRTTWKDFWDDVRKSRSHGSGFVGSAATKRVKQAIKRKARAIENAWLAYQYGIAPIVSDVMTIAATVGERLGDNVEIPVTKYDGRDTFNKNVVDNFGERYNYGTYPANTATRYSTWECGLTTKCRIVVGNSALANVASWGINPIYLLWESLTLSFVFDQIIPIGRYLANMDAMIGIKSVTVNDSRWLRGTTNSQVGGLEGARTSFKWSDRRPTRSYLTNPLPTHQWARSPDSPWIGTVVNFTVLLHQRRP